MMNKKKHHPTHSIANDRIIVIIIIANRTKQINEKKNERKNLSNKNSELCILKFLKLKLIEKQKKRKKIHTWDFHCFPFL